MLLLLLSYATLQKVENVAIVVFSLLLRLSSESEHCLACIIMPFMLIRSSATIRSSLAKLVFALFFRYKLRS